MENSEKEWKRLFLLSRGWKPYDDDLLTRGDLWVHPSQPSAYIYFLDAAVVTEKQRNS